MSQQPAGWYDDPSNPEMLRYWDGVTWSSHTAPRRSPTASQSAGGLAQQQAPANQGAPGGNAPTTPMPQGSGWAGAGQPAQVPQAPQYPGAPGSPGAASWMHNIKTTADGVPLASWGRRLGAWLIDGVILLIISYVAITVFIPSYVTSVEGFVDAMGTGDRASMDAAVAAVSADAAKAGLVSWIVSTVYCVAFWTTLAQTPGKLALGISVRRADRPGVLDLSTALRRRVLSLVQIIPIVSAIGSLVVILDGLWPLWDDKRQSLHDKIATTQVVMGKQPRRGGPPTT